eukprot:TRINITY_DN7004_c0_g1_i1.p1 TRINITY_DN7004_c0_g1~~TRINITY_DN7004_c0_g1_i1.p1  ORF type:complete len:291 (-),score=62.30 TRINITY_DN7004_c0_g1_i1:75-947(-)
MKVALVIGATRGIGRSIAIALSNAGWNVGVAGKTETSTEKTPGSIFDVAKEINSADPSKKDHALPLVCDCRKEDSISEAVDKLKTHYGRLDYVVYNAGAVWWESVQNTPLKRFDLLHQVNVRGSYAVVQKCLPEFLAQKSGRFLLISPPIYSRFFKGKVTYSISKVGMTVLTHGLAGELQGTGVSICSLWPSAAVASHVTDHMKVGGHLLRKPQIMADAARMIGEEPNGALNGLALIDEDYLRTKGITNFTQYRVDPEHEPPRMLPVKFPSLKVAEEDQPPVIPSARSRL